MRKACFAFVTALVLMVPMTTAANSVAGIPGLPLSELLTLRNEGKKFVLPNWVPDGFTATVDRGTFEINGQRFVTVEYVRPGTKQSFAFQFADVHLGQPLFADETANPRTVGFASPAWQRGSFKTARVRGFVEAQTPWLRINPNEFPRFGAFVSLDVDPKLVKRILESTRRVDVHRYN